MTPARTPQPPAPQQTRSRRLLIRVIWIAWFVCMIVTALGFTAAWVPLFELINDVRPLMVVATLALFLVAMALRERALLRPTASLALLQAGLLLLPWARAADRAPNALPALRLVTFDLGSGNERFDDIADFMLSAGADIVLLQNLSCPAADRLIPKLKAIFPNALVPASDCAGQALLSRRAWTAGGQIATAARRPLMVWARFQWDRNSFVLTGVHLASPFHPNEQALDVERLRSQLATQGSSHIVAGDFNLTPFAWKFAQLQSGGLGQHTTYLATWPDRKPFPLLLPDNVLSTDNIASVRVTLGPALGSDHRPLIADIAFVK